jgi:hypothetical protein
LRISEREIEKGEKEKRRKRGAIPLLERGEGEIHPDPLFDRFVYFSNFCGIFKKPPLGPCDLLLLFL